MIFRTTLKPLDRKGEIAHSTPLFLMGSCFTDSVGGRLRQELFQVLSNPFGTVYNPASMAAIATRIADGTPFTADELVEAHGMYHSFMAHSSLSSTDRMRVVEQLNERLHEAREFIKEAHAAVITLGTAYVYELRSSGEIVSNCHKLPACNFTRRRISVAEATERLIQTVVALRRICPELRIIFTVSPIRHTADGLHENQLSKSTLLLAIDNTVEQMENAVYFPAYEALIDELRDYRFYAADMKHPSEVAVNYVHELFAESFFTSATADLARRAEKFTRRTVHRPLGDDAQAYITFKEETIRMAHELMGTHPELQKAITKYLTDYELLDK